MVTNVKSRDRGVSKQSPGKDNIECFKDTVIIVRKMEMIDFCRKTDAVFYTGRSFVGLNCTQRYEFYKGQTFLGSKVVFITYLSVLRPYSILKKNKKFEF